MSSAENEPGRGYLATFVGVVTGLFVPPVAAFIGIYLLTKDAAGENWGLQYVLVLPFLLVGVFVGAPLAAGLALGARGYEAPSSTAWRVLAVMVPGLLLSLMVPLVPLVAVPFVARWWALRSQNQ